MFIFYEALLACEMFMVYCFNFIIFYFYNPELLDEKFSYSEGAYPYYAIWWKVTYNNGYTASYICSIRYNVDGLKDKDYNARN